MFASKFLFRLAADVAMALLPREMASSVDYLVVAVAATAVAALPATAVADATAVVTLVATAVAVART